MIKSDLKRLCRQLDYEFKTIAFLQQALTHRSYGSLNNERLEFLGDSILSFVIAHVLYTNFQSQSEGKLSRLRAYLVRGEMLAEIAVEIDLGNYLNLGRGELRSGGFRRESILADTLEAIFAAVFLDGGMAAVEKVILKLYQKRLEDPALNDSMKDAKTLLQEFLQAKKIPLPEYQLTALEGEEHEQIFSVRCCVSQLKQSASAKGNTRRKAEQEAARLLLELIKAKE